MPIYLPCKAIIIMIHVCACVRAHTHTQHAYSIVFLSISAVQQRKPASNRTTSDGCHDQENHNRCPIYTYEDLPQPTDKDLLHPTVPICFLPSFI